MEGAKQAESGGGVKEQGREGLRGGLTASPGVVSKIQWQVRRQRRVADGTRGAH